MKNLKEGLVPTGCATESRTINDSEDEDGKWYREITVVKRCRLIPSQTEGKLTKAMLDELIHEQIRIFVNKNSEEEIDEASKKKTKPNCSPGNVYHDEDGRFTDKADADVYSLQFVKGGSDCKRGVARMPGQRFTRLKCGRKSKHGPGKAKYKCKDGSDA